METKGNLAARAGRWSAAHWKTATVAWIVFVVVAIFAGALAGNVSLKDSEQGTGETARAEAILEQAGFKTPANESVLVTSRTLKASSPAFKSTVADVLAGLKTMPQVTNLRTGQPGEISKDGHAQLVQFDIKGDINKSDKRVQPVIDRVAKLQQEHSSFTVAEFGFASANKELNDTLGKDFQKAEKLSVPITFLILLIAFGAFVAAGVPVLLAFTAVLARSGCRSSSATLHTRPMRRSR